MPSDSPLDLAALRRNYALETLDEQGALPHPVDQFDRWFREALQSQLPEPNAMTLATADRAGRPSARTVLLKGFNADGFVFFTNYESRKGGELSENPRACLLFTWLELERQVRIEGAVEKVSEAESLEYYQSRPRGSQIGAWASPQSRVIHSRAELEERVREFEARYQGVERLPRPAFWGGFRLRPDAVEFWQGRESRLHDRLHYVLRGTTWVIERLAP